MTQQTLRDEFEEKFGCKDEDCCNGKYMDDRHSVKEIAQFFLARFKEFAEKELIGHMEKEMTPTPNNGRLTKFFETKGRNALRNEQQKILSEKLK